MAAIAPQRRSTRRRGIGLAPTALLLLGALYCLLPVSWVLIAATKSPGGAVHHVHASRPAPAC